MCVRVGRDLIGFNLPGQMSKEECTKFELKLLPAFDQLTQKYGGNIHLLISNAGDCKANKKVISEDEYQMLIDDHDFPSISSGSSNYQTCERGCWQSENGARIIWFGEEDLLRIMCMTKGSDLLEVFSESNEIIATEESIKGIHSAKNKELGCVTSNPSDIASKDPEVPDLNTDVIGTMANGKGL
eukprot:5106061-Ditylum_brightwellii.AAC.1